MTHPTLVVTPRRPAVLAGVASTVDVLVRLQAPPMPEATAAARTPRHLALVIDRSGSMSGEPLREAKRCARFVVSHLTPDDRVALVTYETGVAVKHALSSTSDAQALLRAIDGIDDGGMTNLHGGWLAGAEQLAPHTRDRALSRVILLSDGCANQGLTDHDAIFAQCAELAEAGVTTSTYGLGREFNEDLMIGMAKAGLGSSYYGQTAADLEDPFREELALLDALCARHLEVRLHTGRGVTCEVLNDSARTAEGWRLPDLAYGGEAWLLVRLIVAADAAGTDGSVELLRVEASWQDMEGQPHTAHPVALTLPAMPAAAWAVVVEDPLVQRRVEEVTVARLQEQARTAARQRDWDAVDALLTEAAEMAMQNEWLQGVLEELRALSQQRDEVMFSKEAHYSAHRANHRLARRDEVAYSLAEPVPEFLRRKRAQGKAAPPRSEQ